MASDSDDSGPTATAGKPNTLLLDINSLLHDEDISDITLVPETATGGTVTAVPAIRAILAARSPVFRRMLYGEFRETQQSNNGDDQENVEVKLNYSGRVLQLLVEFCFTDQLSSLIGTTDSSTDSSTSEEKARLLTNLSGAAHYFDIPKLESDIEVQLNSMMVDQPSLACAVLDESSKMLSGEELVMIAMEQIRARPKAALLHWNNGVLSSTARDNCGAVSPTFGSITARSSSNFDWGEKGGVTSLNCNLLEQVIFDEQSTASELTKFICLQKWVEGCQHGVMPEDLDSPRKMNDSADEILSSLTPQAPRKQLLLDETSVSCTDQPNPPSSPPSKSQNDASSVERSHHEKKLFIAKRLAEKIDLSLIPASDLSTTITESKLISTNDLYLAYRLQALNAERTKSKVFVEGAGLAEVNGTYLQRGVHEGTPMYNKEGVWRDREEIFRIFLCTYSNGNKSWCLSVVPKGKEPGKTSDLDFYECPVSYSKGGSSMGGSYNAENGAGVVPSRGWKLVSYGQAPVPKCSLIAGCLEDA